MITEDDVVRAYIPLILDECAYSCGGLDQDEHIAEAILSLLYAMRTFSTKSGSFKEYYVKILRFHMKAENYKASTQRRYNSPFSLYTKDGTSDTTPFSFTGGSVIDESLVDVHRFCSLLTPIENQIIAGLINGYTLSEIASIEGFEQSDLSNLIVSIQVKCKSYFGELL